MLRLTKIFVAFFVVLFSTNCHIEPACQLRGVVIGDIKSELEFGQGETDDTAEKLRELLVARLEARGVLFRKEPEYTLNAKWVAQESCIRVILTKNENNHQLVNTTVRPSVFVETTKREYTIEQAAKQVASELCLKLTEKNSST